MMNPAILIDGYKTSHAKMYPDNTEYIYSNFTARKSRISGVDHIVFFGLQYFIKKYLIESWNQDFFNRPKNEIEKELRLVFKNFCDEDIINRLLELHDLGYLPIKIKAVDEGARVPIGVPCLTIINTHPKFFWLTNYLETILSNILWQPCTSATIANRFYKLLEEYANKTDPNNVGFCKFQGHDFSMRGMSSLESACLSGAAHLLSFAGTDTIPATFFLAKYYNADIENDLVGCSVPACYDKDTEILTENGFIKFEDLKEEKVAQYHSNGLIDFVKPINKIKEKYNGNIISFNRKKGYRYLDLYVTPNHEMVRYNKRKNTLEKIVADSPRNIYSSDNVLIVAGKTCSLNNEKLSAIDRLRIAFQADGSLPSRSDKYLSGQIRFSLKKDRKKKRLIVIIKECGFEYTISKYKNGYDSIWVKTYDKLIDKEFNWVTLDKSIDWYQEFIEELSYWDCHRKNNLIIYSNLNKSAIDKIQAICAISSYKTQYKLYIDKRTQFNRKDIHILTIDKNRKYVGCTHTTKEYIKYNDYVYCVTVPSHMIVIRRNNIVCICGNSEHSVMSAGGSNIEDEHKTFERLITQQFPNGILSIVSDTYNLWSVLTDILPNLQSTIKNRNGKIAIRPDSSRTSPQDIICGINPHLRTWSYNNKKWDRAEEKGLVECLWDIFGGTISPTGYKILHPSTGGIYGDAVTYERLQEICSRLADKNYASTNMVYGIGSYTYQFNTRDTFGFAMKATWSQIDGKEKAMFKDPITDSGEKKSAMGLLHVCKKNGKLSLVNNVSRSIENAGELRVIFNDGTLVKEHSLQDIRNRIV